MEELMSAYVFEIAGRTRRHPVMPVDPADFEPGEGAPIDARIVLEQPNISLYCLDPQHQRALFVETHPDVDLTAAPFYYQAQYEAAERLIGVPYALCHQLAQDVTLEERNLLLIYSVGRCGSTLVSKVLNATDGVVSLSEPDVYTQLLQLRAEGMPDDELANMLETSTRLLYATTQVRSRGSRCALKFRSEVIEFGQIFAERFAQARIVFLYRQLESWARSAGRMFRIYDPADAERVARIYQHFKDTMPLFATYATRRGAAPLSAVFLASLWASTMQRALELQAAGHAMVAMRYEDLQADPRRTLMAFFDACELALTRPEALDAILAQDSQAGTSLSRQQLQEREDILSPDEGETLCALVAAFVPGLTSQTILPHTVRPDQGSR
jgi:hypothetical protein